MPHDWRFEGCGGRGSVAKRQICPERFEGCKDERDIDRAGAPCLPASGFTQPSFLSDPLRERFRRVGALRHVCTLVYLRFTLSLRDVEDLLAERGVSVSYETVRRWVNHFGPMIAADLRKRRPKPHTTWHLDEVYLKIDGRLVYLWRAVDAEGEVLDVLIQSRRNKRAALKLMRKLLRKYGYVPDKLVTDDLRSYGAVARELRIERRNERGRWSRVDDWRSGCRS